MLQCRPSLVEPTGSEAAAIRAPTGDAGATQVVRRWKRKAVGRRVAERHVQVFSASPQPVFTGRSGPVEPAKNCAIFALAIDSFRVKIKSLPGSSGRPTAIGAAAIRLPSDGFCGRVNSLPGTAGINEGAHHGNEVRPFLSALLGTRQASGCLPDRRRWRSMHAAFGDKSGACRWPATRAWLITPSRSPV